MLSVSISVLQTRPETWVRVHICRVGSGIGMEKNIGSGPGMIMYPDPRTGDILTFLLSETGSIAL